MVAPASAKYNYSKTRKPQGRKPHQQSFRFFVAEVEGRFCAGDCTMMNTLPAGPRLAPRDGR